MPKKFQIHDTYFKRAQKEGYRARSVYKLMEIQEKFEILKKSSVVLDLGSAPGSWLQYLVKTVKTVIGVDRNPVDPITGVQIFTADIFSDEFEGKLKECGITQFDVIVSDMAPNTTGINDVDQYASVELNLRALEVVQKHLKTGGSAVFKIFRGEDFNDFWFEAKKVFPNMKTFKPDACRDRSFEIYCVGKRS